MRNRVDRAAVKVEWKIMIVHGNNNGVLHRSSAVSVLDRTKNKDDRVRDDDDDEMPQDKICFSALSQF